MVEKPNFLHSWRKQIHRKHQKRPWWLIGIVLVCLLLLKSGLSPASPNSVVEYNDRDLLTDESETIAIGSCASADVPHKVDQCAFVSDYCTESSLFAYIRLYYCYLDGLAWFFVVVPWLIFLLYALSDTTDQYFCDSIQTIVDCLGLSPNVAGVTLLAFGNGAPDVFGAIASFAGGSVGELGLAELAGSGCIITTLVVSMVYHAAQTKVKVDGTSLFRDIIWYLLSLSYVQIIVSDGQIGLVEAIGCVFVYVVYVVIVAISSAVASSKQQPQGDMLMAGRGAAAYEGVAIGGDHDFDTLNQRDFSVTPVSHGILDFSNVAGAAFYRSRAGVAKNRKSHNWIESSGLASLAEVFATWAVSRFGPEVNWAGKFLNLIMTPLAFARAITVPLAEEGSYRKPLLVCACLVDPLLLTWLSGLSPLSRFSSAVREALRCNVLVCCWPWSWQCSRPKCIPLVRSPSCSSWRPSASLQLLPGFIYFVKKSSGFSSPWGC